MILKDKICLKTSGIISKSSCRDTKGHNNCQLSIVNCQFGEAGKFQFVGLLFYHACAFGMGNRFDGGFTITAFRILQEERMMTV